MNEPPDAQRRHWEETFSRKPDLFGPDPSGPASIAAELFRKEGMRRVLELGAGQGRDTLFFARGGFVVCSVDYSGEAVAAVEGKAAQRGLAGRIDARRHDVRKPLPFSDGSFDACYSHMLFCMALTSAELARLSREVRRVLRPGGLNVYTVRHTGDAHYGTGVHRGEGIYEVDGFAVHFFSRDKVMELSEGYELLGIDEFEEGKLPRKLFRVTLRKK